MQASQKRNKTVETSEQLTCSTSHQTPTPPLMRRSDRMKYNLFVVILSVIVFANLARVPTTPVTQQS